MDSTYDQEVVYTKGCTSIEQLNQLTSSSNDNFKIGFFYNPPEDNQIYHVNISNDDSPSDHTFHYKLDDKNSYQIRCLLIPNSLIVRFLNKKIYGIELKQDEEQQQEYLTFSNNQRINLEFHLKEYLLTSKQINKKPNATDVHPKL